jgi:hypothetical protein
MYPKINTVKTPFFPPGQNPILRKQRPMADSIIDIWKEKFADSLKSVASFNKWLILVELTIFVTAGQLYYQYSKSKKEYQRYQSSMKLPWHYLEKFYDETRDSVPSYVSSTLTPWTKLCFLTWWGTFSLSQDSTNTAHQKFVAANNSIDFARKAIEDYSSAVTVVSATTKCCKSFQDLNSEQILALINVYNFNTAHRTDSFAAAITTVVLWGDILQAPQFIKAVTIGTEPTTDLQNNLLFAASHPRFLDFVAVSNLLLRDWDTFALKDLTDSFNVVRNYLQANSFQNLSTLKNQAIEAKNKMDEIDHGETVDLPLIDVKISLEEFIAFAGFINFIIIYYLGRNLRKIRRLWSVYRSELQPYPNGLATAYFYGWTGDEDSQHAFVYSYAAFLSFISITSFAISALLYWKDSSVVGISAGFTVLNYAFAVLTTKSYVKLGLKIKGNDKP